MTKKNRTSKDLKGLSTLNKQGFNEYKDNIDESVVAKHIPILSSPAANLLNSALTTIDKNERTYTGRGTRFAEYWKRQIEGINRRVQVTLQDISGQEGPPSFGAWHETVNNGKVTRQIFIGVKDTTNISRNSNAYKKFLDVALGEIGKYIDRKTGELTVNPIIIPYNIFVESGAYQERRTAKAAFKKQYINVLKHIEIEISEAILYDKKGKRIKNEEPGGKQATIFIKSDFDPIPYAVIWVNPFLDYRALTREYAMLPLEALGATGKGYDLIRCLIVNARINAKKVKKDGGYMLSIKTVARDIGLPPLEDNVNPGKTFLDPLEMAIEIAEEQAKEAMIAEGLDEPKWKIAKVDYDETSPAKHVYEKGKLWIQFTGEALDNIIKPEEMRLENIQKAVARANRYADKIAEAKGKEQARIESEETL